MANDQSYLLVTQPIGNKNHVGHLEKLDMTISVELANAFDEISQDCGKNCCNLE